MPELPEVTTIVRDLTRAVRGKVIADVWTDTSKMLAPHSVRAFRRGVRGKAFLQFTRRGKFIIAHLGHGGWGMGQGTKRRHARPHGPGPITHALVWHLRMTGHPLYRDERRETRDGKLAAAFADPRNQHVRLSFHFTDGTRLDYSDVRKFGTIRLVRAQDLNSHPPLRLLGPDALTHRWTTSELCRLLKRRRKTLKQALLDQTVIAGIGNIYVDEILWASRLHPLRRTATLTPRACGRIVTSMRAVLRQAVLRRGTSIDDFRDLKGQKGRYGDIRRVYQRAGQPCFRCGARIATLRVGGRGTHVCPRCQPSPRSSG